MLYALCFIIRGRVIMSNLCNIVFNCNNIYIYICNINYIYTPVKRVLCFSETLKFVFECFSFAKRVALFIVIAFENENETVFIKTKLYMLFKISSDGRWIIMYDVIYTCSYLVDLHINKVFKSVFTRTKREIRKAGEIFCIYKY